MTEAERLYRRYRLAVAGVEAAAGMNPDEKGEKVTRLTEDLEAAERELGIVWYPVASVTVEATKDGSAELPKHEGGDAA